MATRLRRWRVFALALCLAVAPLTAAAAQSTFQDLTHLLTVGDHIVLVDTAGRQFSGRLEHITPTEVVLRLRGREVRSRRTFERREIRRLTRGRDSLANGLLIGFAVGATFGCAVSAGFSGETRSGDCVAGGLMFGAVGLAIGVRVDALSAAPTLVYQADDRQVWLAPLLSPGVLGVKTVLTW